MLRSWVLTGLLFVSLTSTKGMAATQLVVEAALDRQVVAPLLAAFEKAHPEIELTYHDRTTLEVDLLVETSSQAPDIVISSAMPWQMNRVNEGYARRIDSQPAAQWPEWAKWRNEIFGFTFEPIVMAYRLDLASYMLPPQTHADLHTLLRSQQESLKGKVTTYSPSESGIGYTLFQQDARYTAKFWDLVKALGNAEATLELDTQSMLEGLTRGDYWLGYNLLGSYAMVWAQQHPEIIVQVPQDYALVVMRTGFIHRDAPNPEAAEKFINFLLSRDGQHVLAGKTPLFSVHPDIIGPYTAQRLRDQVGDRLYPITLNASLLAFVDPQRRDAFMARWQREFNQQRELPQGPESRK